VADAMVGPVVGPLVDVEIRVQGESLYQTPGIEMEGLLRSRGIDR